MKHLSFYGFIIACACGCIATHEVKSLTNEEYDALENSVQQMLYKPNYRHTTRMGRELSPDSWPGEVRKLHPIAVYLHGTWVCIAMTRDAKEEKGYCVVSYHSSARPTVETNGWVWKPVSDMVYLYKRDLTNVKADE